MRVLLLCLVVDAFLVNCSLSACRICRHTLPAVNLVDGYEADTEWDDATDSDESEDESDFGLKEDYFELIDQYYAMDVCDPYIEENEGPITFSPGCWSF